MLTITGIGARDPRNPCSRCPERLLTITGIGAHDRSESVLTIGRNTHQDGIGLEATRARLAALYGRDPTLRCAPLAVACAQAPSNGFREGRLSERDFPDLAHAVHDRRWSGTLTLTHRGIAKSVVAQDHADVDPLESHLPLGDEGCLRVRPARRTVMLPELIDRMSIVMTLLGGRFRSFGAGSASPELAKIREHVAGGGLRLPRRDLSFAVEKLLVWSWLTGQGPLTRKRSEATVGCTYPTVAGVLKRLGSGVRRHSDRRVELTHLSRTDWARLAAVAPSARATLRFADRSGQPASASSLLARLNEMAPPGVAIGGVAAAQFLDPEFDLVGLPRLDVSVHAPGRDVDLGFVRRLDPALKAVTDPAEPALLVLHYVRHHAPLFQPRGTRLAAARSPDPLPAATRRWPIP